MFALSRLDGRAARGERQVRARAGRAAPPHLPGDPARLPPQQAPLEHDHARRLARGPPRARHGRGLVGPGGRQAAGREARGAASAVGAARAVAASGESLWPCQHVAHAPLEERRARLDEARLYFVTEPLGEELLAAALAGGVDMLQLRDKQASDDEILAAAPLFRSLCDRFGALFLVNDRPDLARPRAPTACTWARTTPPRTRWAATCWWASPRTRPSSSTPACARRPTTCAPGPCTRRPPRRAGPRRASS